MKKLNWPQRIKIAEGIRAGKSNAQIARDIGVHRSTVGREIERNAKSREEYAAREADDRSWYRQQDAVPKRMMLFGGVDFFTVLQKREVVYTFVSHTHLNCLSRWPEDERYWDTNYIRQNERNRFMEDSASSCFRMADNFSLNQWALSDYSKPFEKGESTLPGSTVKSAAQGSTAVREKYNEKKFRPSFQQVVSFGEKLHFSEQIINYKLVHQVKVQSYYHLPLLYQTKRIFALSG